MWMERRDGFTLVEVVVALMLLTTAVMGMQLMTAQMLRRMTVAQVQLSASQLAEDRLDQIRLEPNYANIPTYAGTENTIAGFPSYTRITTILQQRDSTEAGITDFRRITVEVRAPALTPSVRRTLVIGAP